MFVFPLQNWRWFILEAFQIYHNEQDWEPIFNDILLWIIEVYN